MKETLRTLFQQKFNPIEYRKVVLQNLLHAQQLLSQPQFLEETNDGDRIYGLGYLTDADGKQIGLYYTDVVNSDVRRKRVGFRQMMKKYTDFGVDAAIAVFADKEHWRLSYMSDLKGGETSAKRFSYILGDLNGQYNTPVNRLAKLGTQVPRLRLKDIFEAFSVETLSKEFFDGYHRHYDTICGYLTKHVEEFSILNSQLSILHDYVKKMMGRIVFLHFLQKKGWLNDDTNFMQQTFSRNKDCQDDFLEKILEPLFFGFLNTRKEDRAKLFDKHPNWDKNLLAVWENIPYLNGGLFEQDEVDSLNIRLPRSMFDDLFTFLAEYNFTVDENDPDDAEVGVDPEMLGKIFESLLEDNKAKGAFYTPKEIVRYMCKESLIAYLSSCVSKSPCPAGRNLVNLINSSDSVGNDNRVSPTADGVNNLQDSQDFASETSRSIRRFVETHEMQPELEPYRDILDTSLRNVKICDPAIGSGAFPMGLLNELWRCREALAIREANNLQDLQDFVSAASRSKLKKEIIENNIYGVDIEKGAIDIARLRFWLSIVVDAEEPEPLPNFDYKFMQGNSLIESYKGIDLSRISNRLRGGQSKSTQLLLGLDSDFSKKNLQRLMRDYFSVTDHKQKSSMRQAINDEVKRLITDFIGGTTADLDTLDPSANQDFFLWHTWFKDIFDNGGFDIVIGNPPYIQLKWLKEKNIYQSIGYNTFDSTGDIYVLFYEKATRILKEKGIGALITSNKWLKSNYGELLRKYLITNTSPLILLDLGAGVFETASVDTNVLLWKKEKNGNAVTNAISLEKNSIMDIRKTDYKQISFPKDGLWSVSTSSLAELQSKIEKNPLHIIDYGVELYYGILTGANPTFIIDKATAERLSNLDSKNRQLIKPILRGKDIDRYRATFNNVFLLCVHNGIKQKSIPPINIQRDYPTLMPYFNSFGDKFLHRGEQGDNYWNLRNCAYLHRFNEKKIIYADIVQDYGKFYLDRDGYYTNDTAFIIAGDNLEFLLGLLNSKLFTFVYKNFYCGGTLGNKGLRFKRDYILRVPFPETTMQQRQDIKTIVNQILSQKQTNPNVDTLSLEHEIDKLVYQLYNLTSEEIVIIEKNAQ